MKLDTDVLIVGGGPTGLMMACQLLRFGVSFKIIDKQADRTHESRAFAIQAKSMEIFQNLDIVSEFLKQAQSDPLLHIFINGKQKLVLTFGKVAVKDTPFPSVFFLPQSETERILLQYVKKQGIKIERQTSLISFSQTDDEVIALIRNEITNKTDHISCRYIVGCDGAHSTVRHLLNVPFEGAPYLQEFILADATINWSLPPNFRFVAFFDKAGIFLDIALDNNLSRIMGAKFAKAAKNDNPITPEELESFGKEITHTNIKLTNIVWMSRFRLHHRAVKQYQIGRAFLAGDAAHIHSPVGGQGMNTGLQDATNLAWKIAFVIKKNTSSKLLETYQLERQRIGEILLKTTDRIFKQLTSKNFIISVLRQFLMPIVVTLVGKLPHFQKRIFQFISQLGIHYHENEFIQEKVDHADKKFLSGPQAGCRAPDAPINNQTLFELFKKNPCNILIFKSSEDSKHEQLIADLKKTFQNWLGVYEFTRSPATQVLFDRYGVSSSGIYFIRPDGYIGFRAYEIESNDLFQYVNKLFGNN